MQLDVDRDNWAKVHLYLLFTGPHPILTKQHTYLSHHLETTRGP